MTQTFKAVSLLAALTIPLIVLTHLGYGLGFWRGLFTRLGRQRPEAAEVVVEVLDGT